MLNVKTISGVTAKMSMAVLKGFIHGEYYFSSVEGTLEGIQKYLGGLIRTLRLPKGYVLVFSDDAEKTGAPSLRLPYVTVYGNYFVCKADGARLAGLQITEALEAAGILKELAMLADYIRAE